SPQGSTPLGLLPEGRVLFLTVGQIKRPETERRFPHGRNRGPLTRGQRQTALIRLRPGQQKADDVGSSLQEPTQEDDAWVPLLMPFPVGQDLPKKLIGSGKAFLGPRASATPGGNRTGGSDPRKAMLRRSFRVNYVRSPVLAETTKRSSPACRTLACRS